ncbi:MAG TPA: DNA polymerase III subunit delta [Gemmatimonadales bacterium]
MAGLTIEKVYGALKRGEVAPTYYLTGTEETLKDELVAAIVDAAVDRASRDFNLDVRSAGDLTGESLHALIETPPMLAERRAVVVRGLDQWRRNAKIWKVLDRYIDNPSPTTVLILTESAAEKLNAKLARVTTHVAVDGLKPNQVRRWLSARARRCGIELEDRAADHLVAAVGGDLSSMALEIEKLAAAAEPGRPVTAGDVAQLVGVRHGETVSDWIDLVLRRATAEATAQLDSILALRSVSGVQLVAQLGTALVGVRVARALLDDGAPATRVEGGVLQRIKGARPLKLRTWSLEAKTWTRAASEWTAVELDAAIAHTYDADRQLKSTTISNELGTLKTLLLRLSRSTMP